MHRVLETTLLLGWSHTGTDCRGCPVSLRQVRQGSKGQEPSGWREEHRTENTSLQQRPPREGKPVRQGWSDSFPRVINGMFS